MASIGQQLILRLNRIKLYQIKRLFSRIIVDAPSVTPQSQISPYGKIIRNVLINQQIHSLLLSKYCYRVNTSKYILAPFGVLLGAALIQYNQNGKCFLS